MHEVAKRLQTPISQQPNNDNTSGHRDPALDSIENLHEVVLQSVEKFSDINSIYMVYFFLSLTTIFVLYTSYLTYLSTKSMDDMLNKRLHHHRF